MNTEQTKKTIKFTERVEKLVQSVDSLMRNRAVSALMTLINSITLLINADKSLKDIVKALAVSIIIALVLLFFGYVFSDEGLKTHKKAAAIILLLATAMIPVIIFSEYLSYAFQYCIAILAISLGLIGLFGRKKTTLLNDDGIQDSDTSLVDKDRNDIRKAIVDEINTKKELLLKPVLDFSNRIKRITVLSKAADVTLIAFGIIMIIFRFETNTIMIRVSAGIMLFYSVADLCVFLKSYRIKKKLKKTIIQARRKIVYEGIYDRRNGIARERSC